MKINFIKSKENSFFKLIKRLLHPKKRKKESLFLIEGKKFVQEALKKTELVKALVVSEDVFEENIGNIRQVPVYVLSPRLMKEISALTTPQGIMAILKEPVFFEPDYNISPVLLLDRIQDPSNLGAILRVADAAGCSHIFLTKGTADPYSYKSVRASAGSILHVKIFKDINYDEVLKNFIHHGFEVWATTPHLGENLFKLKPPEKILLILGNEAQGIQNEVLKYAHKRVYIPIFGQAESLNVSVAAGIFLYYLCFAKQVVKF